MKIHSIIVCCLLFLPCLLNAEGKKNIQVDFKITEEQYLKFYGSAVPQIEKSCESSIVNLLNQTFGFFQFTTDTTPNNLHIELTDSEQNASSNSALKEVGFKVSANLEENSGAIEPVYWVFRPVEKYIEALPDVDEDFINKVLWIFKSGLDQNKKEMVENIFSKVEVADDFYFIQDEKVFILPLSEEDNNIADSSRFHIISSVPNPITGTKDYGYRTKITGKVQDIDKVIATYNLPNYYPHGSIVVQSIGTGATLIDLSNANVVAKRIFIVEYVPLVNKTNEILPRATLNNSNEE
ncbi:MAG TPA: hypothetical protein VKA27_14005 [Sunxiuqinia sp.]|nr:hypothetical protein [Sunxiuqinia sp.]